MRFLFCMKSFRLDEIENDKLNFISKYYNISYSRLLRELIDKEYNKVEKEIEKRSNIL